MLELIPMTLAQANDFVAQHHRHHGRVQGHKFSIGCMSGGQLAGVVIAGRPVGRYLDDGFTLEGHASVYAGRAECVQLSLCRRSPHRQGDGLPEDHHLHAGHGDRGQHPRGGLALCRSCRWDTLDRPAQTAAAHIAGADEIPL